MCVCDFDSIFIFDFAAVSYIYFLFTFSFSHGLNQAKSTATVCCKRSGKIDLSIHPATHTFSPVCCVRAVIHFGLRSGWWFHFVTRLISNAQMRKIALNVRNAEIGPPRSRRKWIKRRLVLPARCGNNAEMPAIRTNLAVISQLSRRQNWAGSPQPDRAN